MKKILKFTIASVLTVSLSVATVVCCCIAPSVMAHLHKVVTCNHCPEQGSHSKSSNPLQACQQQLTSAEFLHGQTIVSTVVIAKNFPVSAFLISHQITLTRSLLFAYPPGGPPLGISFTPLYLRTFNLRI